MTTDATDTAVGRLKTVDSLLEKIGTQQLALKEQDALVRDVRDRLKIVESQVRHHTDAVQELKSQATLGTTVTRLTDEIDTVRKQLTLAGRESKRKADKDEEKLESLQQQIQALCEDLLQTRADVDGERESVKHSMMELIEKVAQQFDAHDTHMRNMASSLSEMKNEHASAIADIRHDFEVQAEGIRQETRSCLEEKCRAWDEALQEVRESEASTSSRVNETLVPALEGLKRTMGQQEASLESMSARVESGCQALEEQLDKKTEEMVVKFTEYKEYVGRLRKELATMNNEFVGSRESIFTRVTSELDGAEETMEKLREHFKGKINDG